MMVLRKLREQLTATFLIRSSRGSHEFDSASIAAVAKSTALVRHLQNTRFFTPEGRIRPVIGPKISTYNILQTSLCGITQFNTKNYTG